MQAAQRSCEYSGPGGAQSQVGRGSGQPDSAVGNPGHGRGLELDGLSSPFQASMESPLLFPVAFPVAVAWKCQGSQREGTKVPCHSRAHSKRERLDKI